MLRRVFLIGLSETQTDMLRDRDAVLWPLACKNLLYVMFKPTSTECRDLQSECVCVFTQWADSPRTAIVQHVISVHVHVFTPVHTMHCWAQSHFRL